MAAPRRRTASASPALRIGLLAGLSIGIGGYAWTNLRTDTPDSTWRSIEMDVDGLDCAFWCSVKVQAAFDALAGTHLDTVDVGLGRVALRYDPARWTAADVAAAVESRGFPVRSARER